MKGSELILIIFFLMILLSCKNEDSKTRNESIKKLEITKTKFDVNELEKNYTKWWAYHTYNISLSSNFIGLNEKSDTISKKKFLEILTTGKYIPFKIELNSNTNLYKLIKLDSSANEDIARTIKSESLTYLTYFKMEGQKFPKFEFIDLNGNNYTNESIKGKTIVLKTWFINCAACVAEFPELNDFVEKYKQNSDVVFVSLATDSKIKLERFLQKKEFKYKVVPNQKEFIEKLNLHIYPTHLIVDKNGIIKKVVNKASEMIAFFEHELQNQNIEIGPPPPM